MALPSEARRRRLELSGDGIAVLVTAGRAIWRARTASSPVDRALETESFRPRSGRPLRRYRRV
jgi:hypothetical protein